MKSFSFTTNRSKREKEFKTNRVVRNLNGDWDILLLSPHKSWWDHLRSQRGTRKWPYMTTRPVQSETVKTFSKTIQNIVNRDGGMWVVWVTETYQTEGIKENTIWILKVSSHIYGIHNVSKHPIEKVKNKYRNKEVPVLFPDPKP